LSLKDVLNAVKVEPPKAESMILDFDAGAVLWGYYAALNEAPDESRGDGNHPSQLYKFCPRKEILKHFFPKPEADLISPETQTAFDWGTAWHWLLQNHRYGPMGHLWGDWRCERCASVVKDSFMPPPHMACREGAEKVFLELVEEDIKAGKRPRRGGYWRYKEPQIRSGPPWDIVGQCDGIMYAKPWKIEGDPFMLEIKTAKDSSFQKVYRPDPSYVFQISLYLHFLGIKRCCLTYWTKGEPVSKPKQFWVTEDPDAFEQTKSRIMLYGRAWPEKRLCPGICRDERDEAGRWCSHRRECFDQEIEAQVEKARASANGLQKA